jgi:thiol-disulfide isomerase/thioredoxin
MSIPLSQEQFEAMWWTKDAASHFHKGFLIYFTAAWCGPCKKLDQAAIEAAAAERGIPYFKCDETVNKYTSGYCGVRSFPTFHFCRPKTLVGACTSSDTAEVLAWLSTVAPWTEAKA